MERGFFDHMYGDLGSVHSESPVAHDDDSVDIYSGLDNSPRISQNAGKSCTPFSPRRLKDSMDLYEEIIKEEQQEKEATCNELKNKLDAAQNHVKELLQQLEKIQLQNTSVQTENLCLKKNICALFKTARMEILRKDDEISRLTQRGGRGGYCPSFTRSQTNFRRNQDSSQNSAPTHNPVARLETQFSRVNGIPKGLPKPHTEARSVSLHTEPLVTSLVTTASSENSRSTRTVPKGLPKPHTEARSVSLHTAPLVTSLVTTASSENSRSTRTVPKGLPKPHTEARSVSLHTAPLVTSLVTTASSENSRSTRTDSGVHDSLRDSDVTSSDRDSNILQTPKQKGLIQQTCKSYPENNDKWKDCGMQSLNSLDKSRKSQCSEVGDHQDHRDTLDASKENKLSSGEKFGKESKQAEKDCLNFSRGRHQTSYSELHRNLERGKSPPHQRNHSPSTASLSHTASSSHSQKMRPRDMEPPDKSSSQEFRSKDMDPPTNGSLRVSMSGDMEPPAKSSSRVSMSGDMEPPAKSSSRVSMSGDVEPPAKSSSRVSMSGDVEPPAKSSSRVSMSGDVEPPAKSSSRVSMSGDMEPPAKSSSRNGRPGDMEPPAKSSSRDSRSGDEPPVKTSSRDSRPEDMEPPVKTSSRESRSENMEQPVKSSSRESSFGNMEPPAKSSSRESRTRDMEPPAKSSSRESRSGDMEPPVKSSSRESRSGDMEPPVKSSSRESRSENMEQPVKSSSRESSFGDMEPPAKSSSRESRTRDMEPPTKSSSRESRHRHRRDRGDRNALKSFGKEGKHSDSDQGRLTNKSSASSRKGSGSPMRGHCRKEERSREERNCSGERKGYVTDKKKDYDRNKEKYTDTNLRDSNRKVEEKKDKVLERNICSKNGKQTTPNSLTTSSDCSELVKKGQEVRKGFDKHLALVQDKVPVNNGVEPEFAVRHEAGDKILPEEGNQNRKLSFMETLNLTLSPVKKPRLSSEGKEQEISQSEDISEGPHETTSHFNLDEEFLVLDELDSSNEISEEMDHVFEPPPVDSSEICEAEKGQGPLPELERNNFEKENEQGKEEGLVKTRISSMKAKCSSESIVGEDTVLQSADRKLPTASVDQPTKLATSQEPIDSQGSGSASEMIDGDVIAALPKESLNSATEGLAGASVVQTVQITDDIHMCSSNIEGRTSLVCQSPSVKSVESLAHDPAIVCVENCSPDSGSNAQLECQKIPLAVLPESISQDSSTAVPINRHPRGDQTGEEACDISTDAVSSTVSIEMVSQSTDHVVPGIVERVVISSAEAEKYVEKPATSLSLTTAQSTEMPKVSSTFRDETVQSEQWRGGSLQVAQDCCISEPDSTEDEEWNSRTEPSSSVPLAHDEDSMMLTLKNIQLIPEAISPLTSPFRPVKKRPAHSSGTAQHVRSLSKDFSSLTGVRRMDVNKENEIPHCSSTQFPPPDSNQTPPSHTSRSKDDSELEEGEIVSDSEEEEPPVIPSTQLKKPQTVTASKMQPSPKSPRLAKKQAQKAAVISQGHSGMKRKTTSTPNNSPTSNKRHKTVLPLLPNTEPSSISDVMDMLKLIQTHLRKKYMKLPKNFTKTSFSNIIEISLCSFTDFVNTVSFSKFCSLESILKPKLNLLISVTMSKISNNGIVNRIFEQQSPSLKKKLWTFAEDQLDFLLREIQTALTSLCNPTEVRHFSKTENKEQRNRGKKICKTPTKPPVTTVPRLKKKVAEVDLVRSVSGVQNKVKPPTITPHRTGLGSRGKNIKMNEEEDDRPSEGHDFPPSHSPSKTALSQSKTSSSGEKSAAFVRRLSHSSVQDKSDFEILTEQQASSLTFNLVTDSQMGEIFKCLLQGSDLLENSVSVGDAHCWPVGTPRKDAGGGESSLVVMTPNKTAMTPSKVIATWSTISPCKHSSPNPKMQIPLNPAILDESCLLEVPSSNLPFCKETPSSTVPSQRSYSVLAEDLAVSLTIPSPLKSDSHLSFLNPEGTEPRSAPESVISAHYSEDALMDGEDASEQDIHLALDSDNSSAGSSGCRNWEDAAVAVPAFHFKPHLPMHAVVTEKSNDHFIVRIRHTSTGIASSPDQNATSAERESQKAAGGRVEPMDSAHAIPPFTSPNGNGPGQPQRPASCENPELLLQHEVPLPGLLPGSSPPGKTVNCANVNAAHGQISHVLPVEPAPTNGEIAESASPSGLVIVTEEGGASKKSGVIRKKRKKHHHSQPRAKRVKLEHTQEKVHKQRKKNSSSGSKNKGIGTPRKKRNKSKSSPLSPNSLSAKNVKNKAIGTPRKKRNKSKSSPLSPNSLSAKNIIRKKGEVVVTWTRDEDRDILIELKKKGASPDTFTALSAKMSKPPALIAERFFQLMKLFKKKERMDS